MKLDYFFSPQNGAIINNLNHFGRTPLMVASRFNSVEIIKYLLKKGAKIEKQDKEYFTPLLVKKYLNLFEIKREIEVFLQLASFEGNPEAVDVLLDHEADIFATDKVDKTVLFWAAANNHLETVKVGIERDFPPEYKKVKI